MFSFVLRCGMKDFRVGERTLRMDNKKDEKQKDKNR